MENAQGVRVGNKAKARRSARQILRDASLDPLLHLQLLLALAVLLGGGGLAYGINNLVIQLFALLLLAIHAPLVGNFWREAGLPLRILVGATLALPLLQLIPLPPAIWQALPGRDMAVAAQAIAAPGESFWMPLSLDRARTLVAFTGLIAPATIVILATMLPEQQRVSLASTLLILAGAAVVWGAFQLGSANTSGMFYAERMQSDVLYATFANRNSTGLFFVIMATIAIALADRSRPKTIVACAIAAGLFALATVLTQSRSSMMLLLVPVLLLAVRLARASRALRHLAGTRTLVAGGVAAGLALLLAMAAVISAAQGGRIAESLERFSEGQADRPEMWEDTLYAAGQYFPVGTGMGTFDEVFQLHESLEFVSDRPAGRAHSDYLELALEAGVAGLALALGWIAWLAFAAFRQFRAGPRWIGVGASAALACIAGQSLLDYPLRNQTLLCLAAVMVALLVTRQHKEPEA